MLFLDVFYSSALPIFILIGIGYIADKFLQLDMQTLSKLSFYAFLPCLLFIVIYESELKTGDILGIGSFLLAHTLVMLLIGMLLYSNKALQSKRSTLLLGTLYYNSANYGIPLIALAYGEDSVSIIAIVMTIQLILFFTLGFSIAEDTGKNIGQSFRQFLKYPVIYVIVLAFIMRGFRISLPPPIDVSIHHIANAYIPFALILLGIQLSRSQIRHVEGSIPVLTLMRLLISPLVAAALMLFFQFDSLTSRVLITVTSLPVAVNVYILCFELNKEAEFASRMIFWTTLASIITVPILLLILGYQ